LHAHKFKKSRRHIDIMTGWGVPAFFVFAGTPLVVANSDAHYCTTCTPAWCTYWYVWVPLRIIVKTTIFDNSLTPPKIMIILVNRGITRRASKCHIV
jgi:hypothetical protein